MKALLDIVSEHKAGHCVERLSGGTLPLTLLSQYLPIQYAAIREGRLANEARAILLDGAAHVLRQYARACRPGTDADDGGVCGER